MQRVWPQLGRILGQWSSLSYLLQQIWHRGSFFSIFEIDFMGTMFEGGLRNVFYFRIRYRFLSF